MNNFGILIKYEWKKLLKKKLVWIAVLVVCLLEAFSNCSFLIQYYRTSVTDGQGNTTVVEQYSGYEYLKRNMAFARALDGRVIDDGLLTEAFEAQMGGDAGKAREYRQIRSLISQVSDFEKGSQELTAENFYGIWKGNVIEEMTGSQFFTEEAKSWWQTKQDQVETPFTYRYAFSWESLLSAIMGIGLILSMAVAICLSDEFAEEHRRRMDQMILCTRNGKRNVYLAKMAAGVTFSLCLTLLLCVIGAICCFGFQGIAGFDAALQLLQANSPYPLTVGQAVLLILGMLLLASILMAVAVMVLSEVCNHNIAVLAIWVGIVLVTMLVEVPQHWRLISQVYSWLPIRALNLSSFWDGRLVSLFGQKLTIFGVISILYPLLAVLLGVVGYQKYRRFQVGR